MDDLAGEDLFTLVRSDLVSSVRLALQNTHPDTRQRIFAMTESHGWTISHVAAKKGR